MMDDRLTFNLLCSGNTVGVFQLESSGMKRLVANMQPSSFEDIVAILALYRPGPLGSGMVEDYVQCKHGRKKVVYPHPLMEDILRETYGEIVYQEQIIQWYRSWLVFHWVRQICCAERSAKSPLKFWLNNVPNLWKVV
ncbi:MAG: hypothetical protein CM1200mP28_17580 [Deltaproteobacteria bacterium]|nr:MAG: hypothetical protein CM1200mP28_17580 [Deltaproteobacteria bacterium]